MKQKTKQIEIQKEYFSEQDQEYLFTVQSGDNTYRVCIRVNGRNICTCKYGYIHRFNEEKKCKHEEKCLEMVE